MASASCLDEIVIFQKKLNKYARLNETDKILYYIHKLNHLNVTVSHLEETGVGKTVNALRHQGGKVGEKARGLVNKWKEMVTAEEEEEEEEDAADNEEERAVAAAEPRSGEREAIADQDQEQEEEEEEYEEDEENCLQIEENANAADDDFEEQDEEPEPQSSPQNPYQSYGYAKGAASDSDDDRYNPMTSQSDYQSHLGIPTTEYHPTSGLLTPTGDSSPEWGQPSPEPTKDWRNGKKSSREEKEKDHGREKEKKSKSKGRHKDRDRSESHERERKKEKHRDRHRDRDGGQVEHREDPEEERKSKQHKDKHRDRDKHHHGRSKEGKQRSDDSGDKSKHEKSGNVLNGFNTPEHKSSKREREMDRSTEDRQRERISEDRADITPKDNKAERTKDSGKERQKDTSRRDKHKRDHRDKDESPGRHRKEKKSKHQSTEDESSNLSSRGAERTEREGKSKHKEEKHKHKDDRGKKDKVKRDGDGEEQGSSGGGGDRTKKEKKSSKMATEMDSGFGAALMGLDSPVKKKKKKKKKEVNRERESGSEEEQPSTSGGYKRSLTGNSTGLPENKKPKLLSTSKDRLPALPTLDVADEKPFLPEITPHYKPLPRLPVRDEAPESGLAKMTEEEALNFVFQSKYNRRSKVYSGKVTGLSYVPSLYETCIRVLQENIDALEFTGGVPFEILRPVLERASPKQLLNLEDYNPYLLDDSNVLWEVHCRRDFKKAKLEEMETWREMWLRCSEERDRKLRDLTQNLTKKFVTKAEPKRTTKIAYVDGPAKVPKGVARAQAKYGTAAASALAAKPGKANEVAARKTAMQNVQRAERAAPNPRPTAAKKKKVAPLMAKTRQFFKKAFRR